MPWNVSQGPRYAPPPQVASVFGAGLWSMGDRLAALAMRKAEEEQQAAAIAQGNERWNQQVAWRGEDIAREDGVRREENAAARAIREEQQKRAERQQLRAELLDVERDERNHAQQLEQLRVAASLRPPPAASESGGFTPIQARNATREQAESEIYNRVYSGRGLKRGDLRAVVERYGGAMSLDEAEAFARRTAESRLPGSAGGVPRQAMTDSEALIAALTKPGGAGGGGGGLLGGLRRTPALAEPSVPAVVQQQQGQQQNQNHRGSAGHSAGKTTITRDQADFLREIRGMSDADIAARYNVR